MILPAPRYTLFAANAKHAATTTEAEKNRLDIQIEALDRQIDNAVYEPGKTSELFFYVMLSEAKHLNSEGL